MMDRYVQWGGNFLDTADVYSSGKSEAILGSWLAKQKREEFVIATKVRSGAVLPPNKVGLSRRHIVQGIQDSLERLQTNYVDLYQMHNWDNAVPFEETLRTFDDLVRCGKVRYVGASNLVGWMLQKIVCTTEKMGINPFISLQQQYSLACRESEFEPFQVCKLEGLGVLPWSPLKGGLLSGKFTRDTPPATGRLGWVQEDQAKRSTQSTPGWSQFADNEQIWAVLDAAKAIGKTYGKTVAQVSLRWLLQKDIVSSVIIGSTKMAQLNDNMGAANGWSLTQEEMQRLDDLSNPKVPYPYEMVWRLNKTRVNSFNPSYFVTSTS